MEFAVTLGGIVYAVHNFMTSCDTNNDEWYDYFNYYMKVDQSYTRMIDRYIMRNIVVSRRIMLDNLEAIPDSGTYIMQFEGTRVGFIKKIEKKLNHDISYYKIFSLNVDTVVKVFQDVIQKASDRDEIAVHSIDTSRDYPEINIQYKICKDMKQNQRQVVDHILGHWIDENNRNTKILIYGVRGTGKTYVGRLLKKKLIRTNGTCDPLLFDDFNPCSVAVNINTLAIAKASVNTPVIILINEIDKIYDRVLSGIETHDNRLQHARNRTEFHTMKDNIGDKRNIVAIYTMEPDIMSMYDNENYASFFRPGRVDFFVHLEYDKATKYTHEQIRERVRAEKERIREERIREERIIEERIREEKSREMSSQNITVQKDRSRCKINLSSIFSYFKS